MAQIVDDVAALAPTARIPGMRTDTIGFKIMFFATANFEKRKDAVIRRVKPATTTTPETLEVITSDNRILKFAPPAIQPGITHAIAYPPEIPNISISGVTLAPGDCVILSAIVCRKCTTPGLPDLYDLVANASYGDPYFFAGRVKAINPHGVLVQAIQYSSKNAQHDSILLTISEMRHPIKIGERALHDRVLMESYRLYIEQAYMILPGDRCIWFETPQAASMMFNTFRHNKQSASGLYTDADTSVVEQVFWQDLDHAGLVCLITKPSGEQRYAKATTLIVTSRRHKTPKGEARTPWVVSKFQPEEAEPTSIVSVDSTVVVDLVAWKVIATVHDGALLRNARSHRGPPGALRVKANQPTQRWASIRWVSVQTLEEIRAQKSRKRKLVFHEIHARAREHRGGESENAGMEEVKVVQCCLTRKFSIMDGLDAMFANQVEAECMASLFDDMTLGAEKPSLVAVQEISDEEPVTKRGRVADAEPADTQQYQIDPDARSMYI